MILRMPEYCSRFKCTADKCSDNCCIGWEIDIDSDTLDFYRSVKGEFGIKLQSCITGTSPSCFVLGKDERCSFLNENNLCEIYINTGEEHLCQICRDHPRYFEWFNGIKEGGTGLCCEESARLIITQNNKFSYTETTIPYEENEEYDEDLFLYMEKARNNIINYMQDRTLSVTERTADVLAYAEEMQYRTDNGDFKLFDILHDDTSETPDILSLLDFFAELEPLDLNRPDYLKQCRQIYSDVEKNKSEFEKNCSDIERYLENIAVYFIWRHFMKGVFNGEFYSYIYFMAAGTVLIKYLCECHFYENGYITEQDIIRIAKDFSKETEYSENNLNAVLDKAYDT